MSELKTNKISTNDGNNVAIDNSLNLKSYDTTARNALTSVAGVLDVTDLKIKQLSNSGYEQTSFRFDAQRSPDGRYILAPEDVIFELRYPSLDIRGSVK